MSRARRQARRASPKGKKRRALIGRIARTVLTAGANLPFEHAKRMIKKHKSKIQKFVEDKGNITPAEDEETLAIQAATVRQNEIKKVMDDEGNDANTMSDAEELYEEEQQDEIDSEDYEGESDAFTMEAIGAVLGVAKKGINRIRQKRFAKGKKFLGQTQAKYNAKKGIDVNVDGDGNLVASGLSNPNSNDPLSRAINDAQGGVVDANLKKYLPLLVIAIVVFFLARK